MVTEENDSSHDANNEEDPLPEISSINTPGILFQ